MSTETECNICGKGSLLKCSGCFQVYYCTKDHQKQDWKNHKSNCISYKIATNDKLGRHLIATRFIGEGEIILNEKPLITGPPQVTPPICLGCYDLLNKTNKRNCSKCGWPVCSQICEGSDFHVPECEITSQFKKEKVTINTINPDLLHPSYQCLTVLRCLHLKKFKPLFWKHLTDLESHCEERKSTNKYHSDQQFIAQFIREFFNYLDFSVEEILKVVGIVQVNAHEIPLKEPGYIAIFGKASFLEHSCSANCMKSFTNAGNLVIRAAKKIAPGEHLSICYTDPLWGRTTRLKHLMETKFFLCGCLRCIDDTEFGTHFNSIRCGFCQGYASPLFNELILKDDEEDTANESWKCQKCSKISKGNNILENANNEYYNIDKQNDEFLEEFIHKFEKVLHPNHYLLISAKLALVDLFTSQGKLLTLTQKNLNWTLKICRQLYELATTLVPAENRLRGVLLYQLQFALMEKNRRKVQNHGLNTSFAYDNFKEFKNILNQSYKLLSYEPDELPEGKMALELKILIDKLEDQQKINFN